MSKSTVRRPGNVSFPMCSRTSDRSFGKQMKVSRTKRDWDKSSWFASGSRSSQIGLMSSEELGITSDQL
jgi:hypothetical protein